jgi:excisionase family DNA binding protein
MRLLSTTECARQHGVTRATIHAAIKRRALPALRVGRSWVITQEACAGYQPVCDPRARGAIAAAARWSKQRPEDAPSPGSAATDGDRTGPEPTP